MNNSLSLNPPIIIKNLFSFNWKIISKIFLFLSVLAVLLLLIFYIFQVNAEVSERYLVQKYDGKLGQLSKESQNLEIGLIQSNSLNNIAILMEELNFEKPEKIHYIRVLGNQVVAK